MSSHKSELYFCEICAHSFASLYVPDLRSVCLLLPKRMVSHSFDGKRIVNITKTGKL